MRLLDNDYPHDFGGIWKLVLYPLYSILYDDDLRGPHGIGYDLHHLRAVVDLPLVVVL